MDFSADQLRFLESFQKSLSTVEMRPFAIIVLCTILTVIFGGAFLLSWIIRRRFALKREFYYWIKRIFPNMESSPRRYEVEYPVAVLFPLTKQPSDKGYTVDLSPDGMFIKLMNPFPISSTFDFVLHLGEHRIRGAALVRWAQKAWSDHHPVGMGCEFINLSESEKDIIRAFLKRSRLPKFVTQPTIKIR